MMQNRGERQSFGMPASGDDNASSDGEESSSSGTLFRFKPRGPFKRKANSDEDDDRSSGESKNSDNSGSDGDNAFNSSPDNRFVGKRSGQRVLGLGTSSDRSGGSSDEDVDIPPAPQPRRIEDEDAMIQQAKLEARQFGESATRDPEESDTAHKLKQSEHQRALQRLRDELCVDLVDRPPPRSIDPPSPLVSGASRKSFALIVSRGSDQRRKFRARPEKTVEDVISACRREFLSAEERKQGVELSLHRGNKLLDDPTQQLMDAGITEGTNLRLEVAGEAGGFAGPPIRLKVRVELKEFVVHTTKGVKFSAFMESFCSALGVPEGREKDVSFLFDGTKLTPDRTPEDENMDDDDLVDAKVPSKLEHVLQSAPREILLMAKPKLKEKNISSIRGQTSRRAGSAAAASAIAATEQDVIVLSD